MRSDIRQFIASMAIAMLILSPISAGFLIVSADDAVAKANGKNKAKGGEKGAAKVKTRKKDKTEKQAKRKTKPAKREKVENAGRQKEKHTGQKVAAVNESQEDPNHDLSDNPVTVVDDVEEIAYGNPGNDKDVGRAGETPNGKDGWGEGSRGRSDAGSEDDYSADEDDFEDETDDDLIAEAPELIDPETFLTDTDPEPIEN